MSDKERLMQLLEKLGISDKMEEVMNKKNINGPTTKFNEDDRLIWLDLSGLGIETLPEDVFEGLDMLRELKLFKNNISELPEGIFKNTPNLTELHLKDNKISKLTKNHFAPISNLNRLFLLGNPLKPEQAKVFPNRPAVEIFLQTLE